MICSLFILSYYPEVVAVDHLLMCTLDEVVQFLSKTSELECKRLPLEWKNNNFNEEDWCKCFNSANGLVNEKLTCKVYDKSAEDWESFCMELIGPCSDDVT